MFTDPAHVRAWEHLDDSVRTGEVAFDAVFGTDSFSHLGRHPELSADRFSHVTDAGGGDGTLLAGVPAARPHLTGAVFDTAEGPAGAPEAIERHGWAGGALRSPGISSARCPRARTSTW